MPSTAKAPSPELSGRGVVWRPLVARMWGPEPRNPRDGPRPARRPPVGPRLWMQPQVSQDLRDRGPLQDGRDDLQACWEADGHERLMMAGTTRSRGSPTTAIG